VDARPEPVTFDDLALIDQAVTGDLRAFDTLMRRHNQRLYRVVRSILRDEAEAEDAVQEAWWKAFNHLQDFRAQAKPTTWLIRIAINEALMRRRRNKTRQDLIQPMSYEPSEQDVSSMNDTVAATSTAQPDHQAWRAELRSLLERHIDALPEHYRTVFMLRGVEELSSAEVAAALDLPEATVRVRFMRARHLLKAALQKDVAYSTAEAFSFAGERCDRIVARVHARLEAAGLLKK